MRLLLLPFLRLIPKGKVTTYGDLARYFGIPNQSRHIGKLLSRNTELDRYPCYKVVGHDGALTGYAGGLPEKQKRLEADGLSIRSDRVVGMEQNRWEPILHSFFLALPLDESNTKKFQQAIQQIKQKLPDPDIVRFQHVTSPHVTLHYFGNLSLFNLQLLIQQLQQWETKHSQHLPSICFQTLSFFGTPRERKVAYFQCQRGKQSLTAFHKPLISSLHVHDNKSFTPHLTLFHILHPEKFVVHDKKIQQAVSSISFSIQPATLCLYGGIDQHRQVPLIDFFL
jgi:O-6-methylguanine DNA methyltransferase